MPEPLWAGPEGARVACRSVPLRLLNGDYIRDIPGPDERYRYEVGDDAFYAIYQIRPKNWPRRVITQVDISTSEAGASRGDLPILR